MAFAEPSALYLPRRGPRRLAATSAMTPPVMCTTEEPAKSTWPCPRPRLCPGIASQRPPQVQLPRDARKDPRPGTRPRRLCEHREPAAAPGPVGVDRIDERADEHAEDSERREL